MTSSRISQEWFGIVLVLFLVGAMAAIGLAAEEYDSFSGVEKAYEQGKMDYQQYLMQKVDLLFSPEKLALADKATTTTMLKSGTPIIMEVQENWDNFDTNQQATLAAMFFRPNLDTSYVSLSGFFRIHYDTAGGEVVPLQDDNGNLVPDFIERTGVYLDSAQSIYQDLGYLPVPTDGTTGGDCLYDVYMTAISAYGATFAEQAADSPWNDYVSYIYLHRNFYGFPPNQDPEGDTIGAQKVTCAHELHHAVQLAYDYDYDNNLWWMEETSVFMEDVVFPEVHDNYNYLIYFFHDTETSLHTGIGYYPYGAFVWPLYLSLDYDISVIRSAWEYCRYFDPIYALDSALAPYGTKVERTFPEFTIWNYFTGDRSIPGRYYPNAADYPQIIFDQVFTSTAQDTIKPIVAPDGLACNYIELQVDSTDRGILELKVDGSDLVRWGLGAVFIAGELDITQKAVEVGLSPAMIYMPFIDDFDKVIVIPSVITPFLSDNDYSVTSIIYPYGDANNDADVNVGDVTYIINYTFKNGPPPLPVLESGDANCDGLVNVADAVKLISYAFKNGPEPCADR